MKNPCPRGSTEPTQSPSAANAKATYRGHTQDDIEYMAGESTNNKPQLRGVEANTADGRASRAPTFQHEAQGSAADDHAPGAPSGFDGYGEVTEGFSHAQGGVGGVR